VSSEDSTREWAHQRSAGSQPCPQPHVEHDDDGVAPLDVDVLGEEGTDLFIGAHWNFVVEELAHLAESLSDHKRGAVERTRRAETCRHRVRDIDDPLVRRRGTIDPRMGGTRTP
jgi:hypothetical protein